MADYNKESSNTAPDQSRRRVIKVALAGSVAAGISAFKAEPAWARKLSQQLAAYQNNPHDGHQCSNCVQFEAPNSCKIVEGVISPDGWCSFFLQKT